MADASAADAAADASARLPIVITAGEPAGVGVDLCLDVMAADVSADVSARDLLLIGDREVLTARAAQLGVAFDCAEFNRDGGDDRDSGGGDRDSGGGDGAGGARWVWHCPSDEPVTVGKPSAANAGAVLRQLEWAAALCMQGRCAGVVTAPVCKASILDANYDFIGVTEFLAQQCGGISVMLMASEKWRVALATTHLPLRQVADAITVDSLVRTLMILHKTLPRYFAVATPPRIAVCGLNPHCGEGGYLGDEEARVISPALTQARAQGIDATGPFAADTLFHRAADFDCLLAMYHDQALPAIKLADFDGTINVTLGLPFLRVSPDHGIAADIAGRGTVRPGSMRAAVDFICARV